MGKQLVVTRTNIIVFTAFFWVGGICIYKYALNLIK